jgi:hypothetical protein
MPGIGMPFLQGGGLGCRGAEEQMPGIGILGIGMPFLQGGGLGCGGADDGHRDALPTGRRGWGAGERMAGIGIPGIGMPFLQGGGAGVQGSGGADAGHRDTGHRDALPTGRGGQAWGQGGGAGEGDVRVDREGAGGISRPGFHLYVKRSRNRHK